MPEIVTPIGKLESIKKLKLPFKSETVPTDLLFDK